MIERHFANGILGSAIAIMNADQQRVVHEIETRQERRVTLQHLD